MTKAEADELAEAIEVHASCAATVAIATILGHDTTKAAEMLRRAREQLVSRLGPLHTGR